MAMNSLTSSHRPPIIGVWVDQEIGRHDALRDFKQRYIQLSTFIEQWHFFDKPETFYNFLDDNPKTQMFVIMSGSIGQIIVPTRHTYENIHCIFIYCQTVQNHRRLKDECDKVKEITNSAEDLYARIADELSLLLMNRGESDSRAGNRGLARLNLEEALRLMRHILKFDDKHGRIRNVNDLLENCDVSINS